MNEKRLNTFALCFSLLIVATMAVKGEPTEESIIRKAAIRNGCTGDDYLILLAIRKAENGGPGRELGILSPKANTLDKQAGWCAASIVKSRARWVAAGKPEDFIVFMGRRYAPPAAHPLNRNWAKNVKYWYRTFKEEAK